MTELKDFFLLQFVIDCNLLYAKKAKIRITVIDDTFNPVPYTRVTRFSVQRGKKYKMWKEKVKDDFKEAFGNKPIAFFENRAEYSIFTKIFFKDKRGGDPENVRKGISDAIFEKNVIDDKNVTGAEEFYYDKDRPRVEVRIVNGKYEDSDKLKKECYNWLLEE